MDRTLYDFFYRYWFRAEVEGIENVPAAGGACSYRITLARCPGRGDDREGDPEEHAQRARSTSPSSTSSRATRASRC